VLIGFDLGKLDARDVWNGKGHRMLVMLGCKKYFFNIMYA